MLLISVLSGVYICGFYSYIFFKRIHINELFISLFIITTPIPLIVYKNAFLVEYYIKILFLFSFFVCTYILLKMRLLKNFTFIFFIKNILTIIIKKLKYLFKNKLAILISVLIIIFNFYKILPLEWRFENHDLLYFGWVNDIFNIDYLGPLRLSFAYPGEMTASNLTPGAFTIPFLLFIKNNIFYTYIIKTFLIFTSTIYFIYQVTKKFLFKNIKNNHLYFIFPFFVLLFLLTFYSFEINYSQSISNYGLLIYVFNLASLCIRFSNTKDSFDTKYFFQQFILNLVCLISFKASTFPTLSLAFLFLGFFLIKEKSFIFIYETLRGKLIFFLGIPILSLMGWTVKQSNNGTLAGSFPLCLKSDFFRCTNSIFINPFEGWWPDVDLKLFFLKSEFTSNILGLNEFIYIWLICIIPSFLSSFYLTKASDKFEFKIFGYFNLSYVFAAIFSILFMRESLNFSGTHTAHSYLIMPFFTISSIVLILITKNIEIYNRIINRYLFIVFTFAFILFNHFNISVNKIRLNDVKNFSSSKEVTMTYNESQNFFLKNGKVCTNNSNLISKFSSKHIDNDGCGAKSVELLYSVLNGRRTNAGLDNDFLKKWVIIKND